MVDYNNVNKEFLEKYELEEMFSFNVNTFESIRWPDPFPEDKEDFEFDYKNFSNINCNPSDANDNVYPQKRMMKG